jgi:hypothetical protein
MVSTEMSEVERRSVELLERVEELCALDGLLERAKRGEGGLVLVEGPAGIGKSSLVDACARDAAERGMLVLRVHGDRLVAESSFAAVRELLSMEVAVGAEKLEGAARLAAPVFEEEPSRLMDRDRAGAVLHGLYWLMATLADRGPMVLAIDDAQWLDPASARFVVYLARRIESLPVLLVVGLRGGEGSGGAELALTLGESASCVLRLATLSENASETLVRSVLGPRAGEDLCHSCHEATGGNPFYLRELAAALADEQSLADIEPSRVRRIGAGAVGRAVLIRLHGLGVDCEQLAAAVAVLGPGTALRHAASLADLNRERAESAADRLRAAELLATGPALSFMHPIVAEATADQLPESRRAALHRQAARTLINDGAPADRVAAHLLSAEPYGEGWIVDALRRAGREAFAQGAPEAAASYLRRALMEPPSPEGKLDVLVDLGRAEAILPYMWDYPAYRQALELASGLKRHAEIAIELSHAWIAVGEFRSAATLLESILEDRDALDPATARIAEATLFATGAAAMSTAPRVLARAAPHFGRY